ncbi:MAG TPA: hypothetical protein PKG56_03660 [Chitinophagaceae bacterium]|nr:hypothetical protein [Chitinophagaceae bacterium]
MKQVYIENVAGYVNQEITIKGWLYNIRSSGKLMFLEIGLRKETLNLH